MAQPQRIMIIRHAEKPYVDAQGQTFGVGMDGREDQESLDVRGWQRAGALSVLFSSTEITQSRGLSVPQRLYASNPENASATGGKSNRPKQTLIPLAQRLGLIICEDWRKGQETELCRDVLTKNGTILISWQHEKIPAIAAALPSGNLPQMQIWPDDRFDLVWVFDLLPESTYMFKEIHQALLSGDLDV